ncbi:site-2 protease family protein [Candidatus Babeliales bacterium]|nr:site-2 protease family protein [Candidatus Babeliales bacterium]MBP9843606.1 site-2 protease family protein [Candidatus Babeliales bacterium]
MILNFLSNIDFAHILSISGSIGLSLIGITSVIVFHEFGHFIFCKLFKVYTPTFSIGIGKKLYTKLIGDTEFCLSASPLGGYVEISTEDTNGKKGFNSINYIQKVLIMLGGIACNALFAYLIFSFLFFIGMPDSASMPYENTIPKIIATTNTSMNHDQLVAGDIIISLNNNRINNKSELIKEILNKAIVEEKTELPAIISRNNEEQSITLKINSDKQAMLIEQRLEVTLERKAPLTVLQSIYCGIHITHFYICAIFDSLKGLLHAKNTQGLAGPVMTLVSSTKVAQKGLKSLLIFLAIISINLGIMNLLPLPIFDGGQFVIFTIETILRREMSENIKDKIGAFSWFLVLGLMTIFSIKDIYILIQPLFA